MHKFIYVSHASAALNPNTLDGIATVSRARNMQSGLTGILLRTEGAFVQLIEGAKPELDETIARIKNDSRHSGMLEVCYEPTTHRTCSEWTMQCFSENADQLPFGLANTKGVVSVLQRLHAIPLNRMDGFFNQLYDRRFVRTELQAA